MTDYGEGLNSALRGVVCLIVSSGQLAGSFLKGIGSGDPSLPGAANALRRSICNAGPSDDLDDLPGGFSGGQCSNKSYDVTVVWDTYSCDESIGPIPNSVTKIGLQGPIRGVDYGVYSEQAIGGLCGSGSSYAIVVSHGNGQLALYSCWNQGCPDSDFEPRNIAISGITVTGGGLDDCGDPPPPDWPPGGNTYDIDFSYTDNTETTVNVEGDTTIFAPIVNLSGQILVPVTVNISPEISLNGTIEISPNFEVNLNPEFTIGGRGGDKPTIESPNIPQPPEPIDEPEDEPAEPPIVGVVVVSDATENRKASQVFKDNQPDLYVPRLGTCSFAIKVGSVIAWTNDIPIKNTNCFIPCPYPPGAIDVRCEPELGSQVTFQVNPIRGNPCLCD